MISSGVSRHAISADVHVYSQETSTLGVINLKLITKIMLLNTTHICFSDITPSVIPAL